MGKRQVFLRLGEAYIPSHLHFSLVLAKFKQHLHEQLELAFRALPNILSDDDGPEEEDRLCGVITRLTQLYTGKLYDAPTTSKKILLDGEALSVENIPSVPLFLVFGLMEIVGSILSTLHATFTSKSNATKPSQTWRPTSIWTLFEGAWIIVGGFVKVLVNGIF